LNALLIFQNVINFLDFHWLGTGKTLSLLCSVLGWRDQYLNSLKLSENESSEEKVQIIYVSRTHSQLSQAISELKKTIYQPSIGVLASRDKLCVNSRLKNAVLIYLFICERYLRLHYE